MMHDDILIVGGYGQVGRVVADRLGRLFPGRVVVAGRSLERAEAFARQTDGRVRPRQLDATDLADLASALDGVRVVVMCVDRPDAGFARACLARGVHYTNVTATYRLIQQIEALHDVAQTHGATAVLSVGLAPGVTNLLAHHASAPFERLDRVDLFVLLGIGDAHGAQALRWMVETAARPFTLQTPGGPVVVEGLSDPKATHLPGYGRRIAYRIDLSDQHVVRHTLGAAAAESRVCFGSALATRLFVAMKRLGVLKWAGRLRPRVLAALSGSLRWGSDEFVVQAVARGLLNGENGVRASALSGRGEAEATGAVAAMVAEHLYEGALPDSGVFHVEQVIEPGEVFARLEDDGFDLHLDVPSHTSRLVPS